MGHTGHLKLVVAVDQRKAWKLPPKLLTFFNLLFETSLIYSSMTRIKINVSDLLHKTWITFQCSPLHQFKLDAASLKRYSRLLSATFVANKNKKMVVGVDEENPPYKGVFSLLNGIAVHHR